MQQRGYDLVEVIHRAHPPDALVVEEPRGTRRIYRLHDEGVAAVRGYLERVWGDAAARFRLVAENTTPDR